MAFKKIRQAQIENLIQDLEGIRITGIVITGDATKTITLTFEDGSTMSAPWTDKDTTYDEMLLSDLNTGTDTDPKIVAAKTLVDWLNSKLSSVMVYKGSVNEFGDLPISPDVGDVWNIQTSYTKQPGDLLNSNIEAGDNVAWGGTEWDVLSHWLDLSIYLTHEVDPKGVQSVSFSGTGNETTTLTITLRDGTQVQGTLSYKDTTYPTGELQDILDDDTVPQVWTGETLAELVSTVVNNLSLDISQEQITVIAGYIVGGVTTLTVANTSADPNFLFVYLNGVKQPKAGCMLSGTVLTITHSFLATPIVPTDIVEVVYRK